MVSGAGEAGRKRQQQTAAGLRGDVDGVGGMVASGVEGVNDGDYDGRTAVHVAAAGGHVGVSGEEEEAGAAIGRQDGRGNTGESEGRNNGGESGRQADTAG